MRARTLVWGRSVRTTILVSSRACGSGRMDADIVVVNHHLFFADLALRNGAYGAVLPDYAAVILDEAHQIEDVASEYFGVQVSNYQIDDLLYDVGAIAARRSRKWNAS